MSDIVQQIVNPVVSEENTPAENTETNPTPVEGTGAVDAPKEDDMSTRFAALSRKEKHLREQEDSIKANQDKYKGYDDINERVKKDPLAVLKQYGISLDDLIAASLGEDAPEATVEEQLKSLRAEIAKDKEDVLSASKQKQQDEEDAYQSDIDEAILVHKNSIKDHLGQNSEKYELISLTQSEDLVWAVTEAHYEETQEVLTPEVASQKVEAHLEGQTRAAMKLTRFQEKKAETTGFEIQESNPTPERKESSTLTQALSGTAPDKSTTDSLSHDESRKAAASLLKWT